MSKKLTFLSLYKQKLDLNKDTQVRISGIVIPKIQRPYAQGRLDGVCTYVRNTLLNELFTTLQTDEVFDFNFIYGIVRPSNDEYVMELLDGQQRMTTLFLLYWYIANRELTADDAEDKEIRDALRRFVYETRSTSTVFCHKMADYRVDINETPSTIIRRAKWYFKSFDRDSTISAMLTMLDAIHERYENIENKNLHGKLENIQFYVKSLGYFNLSEELYIKMNARGLQLTPFENFKADLTNFISNKEYDEFQKLVPLYKKDSEEQVPMHFNFSVKLDAKWIDIFWKQGIESYDTAYMNFFSRFFACKYIVATKDSVTDRDMRQDAFLRNLYTDAEDRNEANEYLGFQSFEKILEEHPEYVLCLDKVFDVFYEFDYKDESHNIFKTTLPPWEKTTEEAGDDFYCNASSKMTHTKLIVFGAIIEFIDAYEAFDSNIFKQWMRVVWNVVENTNIDSLTPVSSLIRKFSAVIHNTARRAIEGESFYEALSQWKDDNTDERENRALIEEVKKAALINQDNQWLDVLIEAENHPFFKGMVMFFTQDGISLTDYRHQLTLASEMFDAEGISTIYREQHILIRAIASQHCSWQELNQRYLTERSESNKYLKNILASNENVRKMLSESLSHSNSDEVKEMLQSYIDNAGKFISWSGANEIDQARCERSFKRLCQDIKLYDWIASEETRIKATFRVYWYEGHIMFAVPRKMYAKVALDTERAKVAYTIAKTYGLNFDDQNQLNMYNSFGDCFGNEIWLYQERSLGKLWVGFCQYHQLSVRLECKTRNDAENVIPKIEGSSIVSDNERLIQIAILEHDDYEHTEKELSDVIEEVFNIIPEVSQQTP